MKFLIVGDQHLSDKSPGNRSDTYRQDMLDKLSFIVDEAKARGCAGIIFNGDLYHVKNPNRSSHALVQDTHEVLKSIPCYFTIGNHDITNNRIDSVPSQPLGSLTRMSNMTLMNGPVDGLPIYSIPYITEDEYVKELPRAMRKVSTWRKKNKYNSIIISSHLSCFPENKPPIYDYVSATDYANLVVDKDIPTLLTNGHIHTPFFHFNPLKNNDKIIFSNYGSISRGSLTEENQIRKVQVHTYDTEDQSIEVIDVPVKPAEQVFRLDSAGMIKERKASMTNFLDSLQKDAIEVTDSQQVVDKAKVDGVESLVVNQIEQLLEWTE